VIAAAIGVRIRLSVRTDHHKEEIDDSTVTFGSAELA